MSVEYVSNEKKFVREYLTDFLNMLNMYMLEIEYYFMCIFIKYASAYNKKKLIPQFIDLCFFFFKL